MGAARPQYPSLSAISTALPFPENALAGLSGVLASKLKVRKRGVQILNSPYGTVFNDFEQIILSLSQIPDFLN